MLIKSDLIKINEYLKLSLIAVDSASKNSRKFFNNAGIISQKYKDIKTEADRELNDTIIRVLSKSDLPILSEEGSSFNMNQDNLYWIIDPLDGTYNFSRGFPIANISIALMYNGEPALGIIKDVYSNNLWYAVKGGGCYYNNQIAKVSEISKISDAMICTGFPSGSNFEESQLNKILNSIKKFKKIRMLGAASSMLSYVANGSFDVYYENDIYLWDVAAGICLIREAGGEIYMKKNHDDYKYEVIASNKHIFNKAKKLLLN